MEANICPNCGSDQIDDKNYCPVCDVVYTITAKEIRPKKIGRMDELEDRVSKLEGDSGDVNPENSQDPPADDQPADPHNDDDDQDPDQDQEDGGVFGLG